MANMSRRRGTLAQIVETVTIIAVVVFPTVVDVVA